MERLIDTWNKAKRLNIVRGSPCGTYPPKKLDSGVNYFILALEKLGCITHYSCEGHFNKSNRIPQFYIAFESKISTIKLLKKILPKTVSLKKELGYLWVLRIDFKNYQDKNLKLTRLVKKWNKNIGLIYYDKNI